MRRLQIKKEIFIQAVAGIVLIAGLGLPVLSVQAKTDGRYTITMHQEHEGVGGLDDIVNPSVTSQFAPDTLLDESVGAATACYRDQLDADSKRMYDLLYETYKEKPLADEINLQFPQKSWTNQSLTVSGSSFSLNSALSDEIAT